MRCLEAHTWPGNVRELENLVRRLVLLAPSAVVDLPDLVEVAPALAGGAAAVAATTVVTEVPSSPLRTLKEVEEDHISRVLEHCGGNKTRAAAILGIDASTLHRRVKTG